jgi:hypothetical protein
VHEHEGRSALPPIAVDGPSQLHTIGGLDTELVHGDSVARSALRAVPECRYTAGMKATTIKLSVATRERLRALGGATYEDTVVEALDALEAERFWAAAEAATAWRATLPEDELRRRRSAEAALDRALDGID